MGSTRSGSPPSHLTTQSTRTTRHQHRPPRTPADTPLGTRNRTVHSRPDKSPPEHTRRPHRDLILTTNTRQHRSQPPEHTTTDLYRQVNKTTPPARELQRRHTAQAPHRTLHRINGPIRTTHRHSTPRQHPQRSRHTHITKGLHQLHAPGHRIRHPATSRAIAQGKQRHHTHDRRHTLTTRGQFGTLKAGLTHHPLHLGTTRHQTTD
ncbi:hypothetical protein, partial [Streptomyces capitiformicae]|uniref:hypothetical protein n=1 Tax=Streptomyces capitiformicae TaxID=2014920 RepID=UPI0027E3CAFF